MEDNQFKNKRKPVIHKKPIKIEKNHTANLSRSKLSRRSNMLNKVRELQEEVNLLTKYSSDTIYKLDYKTMRYDYVSPAIENLLGFTSNEMKKINFRSLIEETKLVTDGLRTVSSFEELEEQRRKGDVGKWQADYLIRTKSGAKIWVSDVSYPWFSKNGKVKGSVGSLTDITDRVRIENQITTNLRNLTNKDPQTGLRSKEEFFISLDKEVKRQNRKGEDLSLIIFEIDKFEEFSSENDQKIKDLILQEFSKILLKTLRETDYTARIEDGIFASILPETEIKGAYFVAERIRKNVCKKVIYESENNPLMFSVSAGVATRHNGEEISPLDMYKLADTRLFIAKNTGKNQVSIDELVHTH